MEEHSSDMIRKVVREHYGKVAASKGCGCAPAGKSGCCTHGGTDSISSGKALDDRWVLRAASGFFGGMVYSLTCGIHAAGIMVMGLMMGRGRLEEGSDGLFPIVLPTQELIRRLNTRLGSHSCGQAIPNRKIKEVYNETHVQRARYRNTAVGGHWRGSGRWLYPVPGENGRPCRQRRHRIEEA